MSPAVVNPAVVNTGPLDQLGRPVRDLRLSVTDRCNFRCVYCMPRESFGAGHAFLPRAEILTYEEFARLVSVFAGLGVSKVRLTGGEPLLRKDLETLVSMVATTSGINDVALTTNGSLLASRAASLREAGLSRVTVSLDSIDAAMFAAMADTRLSLSTVLDGISAAADVGLTPVKLNAVVRRGRNDDGIVELAEFARVHGHVLRFIEYMDVGDTNHWVLDDVVPSAEVIARISAVFPVEPLPPTRRGEVAKRWRYVDGVGEIGVISSVTRPFCTDCTRARVTSTGELFTCLFGSGKLDLRALLRRGASDDELRRAISGVWSGRRDQYSQLMRGHEATEPRAEMSYLGG
jgi:GTP 3',8-cyclase